MKEQHKQALWQSWLQNLLTADEYDTFYYYSHYKANDPDNPALGIHPEKRTQLLESSALKIIHYFKIYTHIVEQTKIHLLSSKQFLETPLPNLGLTMRAFHLLTKPSCVP